MPSVLSTVLDLCVTMIILSFPFSLKWAVTCHERVSGIAAVTQTTFRSTVSRWKRESSTRRESNQKMNTRNKK